MENNFLAGKVMAPGLDTSASTVHRTPTSRSVVVRLNPSLPACIKTFDKMGSVVLELTTF
jgi:hypothetical protein